MLIKIFKENPKSILLGKSFVIGLVLLNILGCNNQFLTLWLPSNPVIVYSSSSTIDALEEIRDHFSQLTKIPVELNFGSTATLATQIIQGSDVDLFLSADQMWADNVVSSRNISVKRIKLLGNKLVVAVPKKAEYRIKSIEDMLDSSFRVLAMANPDSLVPAGVYAKQVLKNLNLWEQLSPKLVYGENVRTALHYLETESVQAAIVYRTDALASSLVRIELELSSELHRDLQYHLVLLEQGNGSDAAFHFFSYLTGEESRQIFKKKGFDFIAGTKVSQKTMNDFFFSLD
ncbi:MAG: molybdate ABC transporter substrate-binding protein [Acidobacteriia bacterium]|nr:molybdate ABC transporter substrate-binding protein [Terriglobia bacterium]